MEIKPQIPIKESLTTRFFMPAWWVHAFESAYRGEKCFRPFPEVLRAGMAPAYTAAEAGLLPTLFSYMQKDFLEHARVRRVRFSPSMVEKEGGLFPESRKKTLQKVFLGLGGLRVFRRAANSFTSVPLFNYENWICDKKGVELELGCREEAGELMTGYLDGYSERNRILLGRQPLSPVMGNRPPLMIWRPLWYELQGSEQMVFLNLEKAVQWQQQCLNLEGVFGESFGNLFDFERNLGPGYRWSLAKKISFLGKLTRKLSDHGSLKVLSSDEFMAFRDQEPVLQLLWKVPPERITGPESDEFTGAAFRLFALRHGADTLNSPWLNSLLPEKHKGFPTKLAESVAKMEAIDNNLRVSDRFLVVSGNRLISLFCLYLEWGLRNRFSESNALHSEISGSMLSGLIPSEKTPESTWWENFSKFCEMIGENRHYFQEMGEDSRFSVVLNGSALDSRQTLLPVLKSGQQGGRKLESGLLYSESGTKTKESVTKTVEEKPHHVTRSGDKKALATDEIVRLQKTQRDAYLTLIEEYLQSLDDSARKLISDIRKRMQPDVFEQHMQHRLVRFMLQDFSRWVSSGKC